MNTNLKNQAYKYVKYLGGLLNVPCSLVDIEEERILTREGDEIINLCRFCKYKDCKGYEQFSQCCREAYRWDGLYTCQCHMELALIGASITDEKGNLVGGMVIGPIFLDNREEVVANTDDREFIKIILKEKEFEVEKIQGMAEILAALAGNISGLAHSKAGKYFYRQENLLNQMYIEKIKKTETADYYTYPIAIERKLRSAVRNRDKEGSQVLLNQILAHIYISNDNQIEAIKLRIAELIAVLSRAAVDAGADVNEIFLINENFAANIKSFQNLEDLSVWVSGILQRFISYTFEFDKVKHADAVYKVIEYIKANHRKKISLDEIAKNTYLSKTYLSSLFKKETGYSISEYINIIKIEKSKTLLMEDDMSIIDIANYCGYDDQSYFTKVFKGIVGVTPKKFRESRGERENQ